MYVSMGFAWPRQGWQGWQCVTRPACAGMYSRKPGNLVERGADKAGEAGVPQGGARAHAALHRQQTGHRACHHTQHAVSGSGADAVNLQGQLQPVVDLQLFKHGRQMGPDRALGNPQRMGDFGIAVPHRGLARHFDLAL